MHQATDARLLAGGDDLLRQFDVSLGKVLAVRQLDIAAMQNADQIDNDILALHQRHQRLFRVNLDFRHLDIGLDDQRLGPLATTRRDSDFHPALRQAVGDIGANETATPE